MFLIKGNVEAIDKFNRRLVKVTKAHSDEAKELLQLMGIPYIDVSACVTNLIFSFIYSNVFFLLRLLVKPKHNVQLW